jgi:hypothetical protein
MKSKLTKYDYLVVGLVALVYYLLLFSHQHSWLFQSGDSSDWLAGSTWWMVVQPFGSPLFILLGQLIHFIMPNHLVVGMTIFLSVIPASITVATTYLICKKFANVKIALVCALVLLGSAVYLGQATVIEEFAISGMFVTLAFYFYVQDKKKLTVLMLALGSAIQIIVVLISVIWLIIHIKELKKWCKTFWIYIVFGLLPYVEVLIVMYLPTPRLLTGGLSLAGLNNYLGASGTIGAISIFETPKRLLEFAEVFGVSLGLAIVPIILSLKGVFKQSKAVLVALITSLFVSYIYLTDSDPITWHFLPIAYPLIMVFVALGLQKMSKVNYKIVGASACVLILVNGVFLNANILSHQYPTAEKYEQELWNLPNGSYVISSSGGYGLENYYLMAMGKDIRPIFFNGDIPVMTEFDSQWQSDYSKYLVNFLVTQQDMKSDQASDQVKNMVKLNSQSMTSPRYEGYLEWMQKSYGLQGGDTVAQVRILLSQGKTDIFLLDPTVTPYWNGVFQSVPFSADMSRVIGVNDQWVK